MCIRDRRSGISSPDELLYSLTYLLALKFHRGSDSSSFQGSTSTCDASIMRPARRQHGCSGWLARQHRRAAEHQDERRRWQQFDATFTPVTRRSRRARPAPARCPHGSYPLSHTHPIDSSLRDARTHYYRSALRSLTTKRVAASSYCRLLSRLRIVGDRKVRRCSKDSNAVITCEIILFWNNFSVLFHM